VGHFDASIRMSMRALEQFRAIGYHAGEALCLNNVAALMNDTGDLATGRAHLNMALALCERHGIVSTRAYALTNLIECDILSGKLDAAQVNADAALALAHPLPAGQCPRDFRGIRPAHRGRNAAGARPPDRLAARALTLRRAWNARATHGPAQCGFHSNEDTMEAQVIERGAVATDSRY